MCIHMYKEAHTYIYSYEHLLTYSCPFPHLKTKNALKHFALHLTRCLGDQSIFAHRNVPYLLIRLFCLSIAPRPLSVCIRIYLHCFAISNAAAVTNLAHVVVHTEWYHICRTRVLKWDCRVKIYVFVIWMDSATLPVSRSDSIFPPTSNIWMYVFSQPSQGGLSNGRIFANLKGENWYLSVVLVYD